jgi:hypothetical protein
MSIAAFPETYTTAWTCLFRNIEITKGQSRGGTGQLPQFGKGASLDRFGISTGSQSCSCRRPPRERKPAVL